MGRSKADFIEQFQDMLEEIRETAPNEQLRQIKNNLEEIERYVIDSAKLSEQAADKARHAQLRLENLIYFVSNIENDL